MWLRIRIPWDDIGPLDKRQSKKYKYIKKILKELPTNRNGSTQTPAAGHLFSLNPDANNLPLATSQIFQYLLAKLLPDRTYNQLWLFIYKSTGT